MFAMSAIGSTRYCALYLYDDVHYGLRANSTLMIKRILIREKLWLCHNRNQHYDGR